MTEADVAQRMRAGGLSLAFDTNALWDDRAVISLSSEVTRYNERLSGKGLPPVRLVVCAVAHAEKLFDLKQAYRDVFDAQVIFDGLRSKGIDVQPFDARHAMETAVRLGERFVDTAAWRSAKKTRCLRCVGLSSETPTQGSGKKCGATVDWLIGAHARSEGCVLVTDDAGPEFVGLVDRVKLDVLVAAVHALLAEAE